MAKPSPPVQVARQLYEAAIAAVADEGGVHAETACSLLAVTLGMTLYRKHHPEPTPRDQVGELVLSDIVTEDSVNILAALAKLAKDGGIRLDVAAKVEPIPAQHAPLMPPVELLKRHGGDLWRILCAMPLSPEDRLLASLFAVLYIVQQTSTMLTPTVTSALILNGFAAGIKTLPPDPQVVQ